jgi:LytS/YehU family sensor histidine kinase
MADPVASDGVLGVKFATLLAGFAGGVVSLSFIGGLTKPQAILSVLTGALTAGYLTPVALHYLTLTSPELQNGVAFFVGLTAMNIVPGLLKLSEMFKRDPRSFLNGNGGDK